MATIELLRCGAATLHIDSGEIEPCTRTAKARVTDDDGFESHYCNRHLRLFINGDIE